MEKLQISSSKEGRDLENSSLKARDLGMVPEKPKCQTNLCAEPALVSLDSLGLCLEHFLSNCYERLDQFEPMIRRRTLEESHMRPAYVFLEECSNCALAIALQQERLTNQHRSRLLNILLLTRHLQLLLKNPLGRIADAPRHSPAAIFTCATREE